MMAWGLRFFVVIVLAPQAADGVPLSFAGCDAEASSQPAGFERARCYYQATVHTARWDVGRARLERLRRDFPGSHWAAMYLGHISFSQGRLETEALYRSAADGFRAQGEAKGEVVARVNLARWLMNTGRPPTDAKTEIARIEAVANASGKPELEVRALEARSRLLEQLGRDIEGAYRTMLRAAAVDVSSEQRARVLFRLGSIAHRLGRFDDALIHYRAQLTSLGDDSVPSSRATTLHNIANSLLEQRSVLPSPGAASEVLTVARRALRVAIEAGDDYIEGSALAMIARLLPPSEENYSRAKANFERCVQLLPKTRQPQRAAYCLGHLAALVGERDPAAAKRAIARAMAVAETGGDRWFLPFAWRHRAELKWKTGPSSEALADNLRLLDVIETLRALQAGGSGRAGVMSRWADDYYNLSGRMLEDAVGSMNRRKLETAFRVIERLRGRTLLERLRAFDASKRKVDPMLVAERQRVLAAISATHRRLLKTDLTSAELRRAEAELESLEREEADVRDRMDSTRRSRLSASSSDLVTLAQVQAQLEADEALLSFQVGLDRDLFGRFGGGAWLIAVTREEVTAHPIADRVALESIVPMFAGLFRGPSGREVGPAVEVYRRLLRDGLDRLPAGVRRLILIPDGRLHQLPFAALRSSPTAPPVGARFALSMAPSATIWAMWRRAERSPASRPALVLASPALSAGEADLVSARFRRIGRRPLGALPHARQEGLDAVVTLGGASTLLVGEKASEHALKTRTSSAYRIVHFATHALIDESRPGRSAILLAAGEENEDGLLNPREIVGLDLAGQVVVLSGCRTAAGRLERSEGVQGLASAFFEAGAHAVVASLWPLRDDDARRFFHRFYDEVAAGARLDSALQQAYSAVGTTGALAGLVLVGNGAIVAMPKAPSRTRRWGWAVLGGGLLAAGLLIVRWRRAAIDSRAGAIGSSMRRR